MNICKPTFPSSPPGWGGNSVATAPCSGARAKEWHRKVVRNASGEVGTDVAVNKGPRTRPSANCECWSPNLHGTGVGRSIRGRGWDAVPESNTGAMCTM